MKVKSILIMSILSLGSIYNSVAQKAASGYILFGKNKTESGAVCTQTGICRLQQLIDPEMAAVTFIASPYEGSETDYVISMSFNIDELLSKQPDQAEYFVDPKFPYTITDKFVFPKWLITALGFEASKNRNITFQPPISLGIPVADEKGTVTLTFSSTLKITK